MSRPLEGKFGIVTGGSRGIGEAIARNLAAKGCSLLLNFTSESSRARTEELCASLASTHSIRCVAVQADLLHAEEAVPQILAAAKQHFSSPEGKFQIDVLINNAGVSADRFLNDPVKGPIDREYFNWHYSINVLAPLLLTQACAQFLPTDRSGRIVNISSVSSSIGFTGQSVYGGTKAALEAMTRTWARELADRATVNAVNPGPVIGDMYFATGEEFWKQMQGFQDATPLSKMVEDDPQLKELSEEQIRLIKEKMGGRRPAFTSEIAGVVGMLCTADGLWCTGSVIQKENDLPSTQSIEPPLNPPTRQTSTLPRPPRLHHSIYRPPTSIHPSLEGITSRNYIFPRETSNINKELLHRYETAKDEFEIATDSTASSTIYAASDRESARDALNQLLAVYSLYTTGIATTAESHAPQEIQQGDGNADEQGQVVNTNFDPSEIPARVRDEVRRRVGQRVRELRNAVEGLEERAHAE
ncbi:L-xylulose reductase [Aspergillus udagawae]|uniref:L-xylulose reductase n=1 Tax=Aspergillus udagawae TaxID=91492 RepID=A0A8H3NXR0_9EURO|nr:L-xylulose reductase [Aspergillus udagawae]